MNNLSTHNPVKINDKANDKLIKKVHLYSFKVLTFNENNILSHFLLYQKTNNNVIRNALLKKLKFTSDRNN